VVLGHVGRLAPEKNLPYLARAVTIYLRQAPAAHFVVVGDGPSRTEIQEIFSAQNFEARLHLVGEASGDALRDAYQGMDMFVFASHTETQGMVLTEAMAAGKPVIALDASGSREVVRDGENGRLLPADTPPEKFAAAISESCQLSTRHTERWIGGARRTAKQFSREVCAEKMARMYQKVLQGRELPTATARPATEAENEFSALDSLAERIKTEWELLSRKTSALLDAVQTGSEAP
jgi:glycosyltransferase involved in cell wall biosynthesis